MIHSFSCKNFYSFGDHTIVDFLVTDKAPNNNGYFLASSGVRLSKIETVVGPNASGKTNLLKVLPFMKWLVVDSFEIGPTEPLPVRPFVFGNRKEQPIELSVDFDIDEDIFTYSFTLDTKRILQEELKVKNKTSQKITSKKIFFRYWDKENEKYELEDKSFNLPKNFKDSLRDNASVISVAIRFSHKESTNIAKFWQKLETNVAEAGWVGDNILAHPHKPLVEALNFYSEDINEDIKKKAEKLLSRFDLGLESFEIEKKEKDKSFSIDVKVGHSFVGQKQYLPMYYESSGTKQLFILLKTILVVLSNGGFAVLDEFDVNLHPEMVLALFELFIQPETNPKNAQLLFSAHSHRVLSELDKYQIVLVEKNDTGVSESWRLDDVSGVRADDNYYAKYIAGAYGAVPKL